MDPGIVFTTVLVGLIAGWLAGVALKGGRGMMWDVACGLGGSVVGASIQALAAPDAGGVATLGAAVAAATVAIVAQRKVWAAYALPPPPPGRRSRAPRRR